MSAQADGDTVSLDREHQLDNDAVEIPVREHRSRVQSRFLNHVNLTDDGCWEWTASTFPTGYGQFRHGDTMREAHRVAFEIFGVDDVQDDEVVRHRCPERSLTCCNPAHLAAGTYRDNWRDAVQDGDIMLEFAPDEIREIRRNYYSKDITQQDLADEWDVTQVLIGQTIRREAYSHVDDDLPHDITKKNGRQGALSDDDVREIRDRYQREDISHAELAEDYPVKRAMIGRIIRREVYDHIE